MPVYSLDDVEQALGVRYTPEQRAILGDMPSSEESLLACAEAFLLFPTYPLSLLDVRSLSSGVVSMANRWYSKEAYAFSRVKMPLHWYLLQRAPKQDSFKKNWLEQQKLLQMSEVVPSTAVAAFATVLHHKKRGERLFESCHIRTSDVLQCGYRIVVTSYFSLGFRIDTRMDDYRSSNLGLVSARKL